jgi:hypothetical protein
MIKLSNDSINPVKKDFSIGKKIILKGQNSNNSIIKPEPPKPIKVEKSEGNEK